MKTITNSRIGYNGRLGNQLFQFASLFGIAKKSEKLVAIPFENTNKFSQGLADGSSVDVNFSVPEFFPKANKFLHKVDYFSGEFKHIQESYFSFDQNIINECREDTNINLDGYFQSPLYFYEYRDELLEILSFDKEEKVKIWERPMVSIHVRRGDYLALGNNHPTCTHEYYAAAIDQFYGCSFMVFSDDIQWCKNTFPQDFYFSENNSDRDDLRDMSLCDHHIIANSTFSWWGAYLNKSKDKRIIAPKNWFGPNYSKHDTSEITSIATKLI